MKLSSAKQLQRFMDDRTRNSHIMFVDEQPRDGLERYYRAADCVVMPSLYEPFGFVAVEAMAAGAPVIASAIDGLREIIDHQQNGLLIPIDENQTPAGPSITALAEAQLRLLSDERLRQRFSAAGQAKVRAAFSTACVLPKLLALYEQQMCARQSQR